MTKLRDVLLGSAMLAALALAGCDKADKVPEGQVVATVDGTEVTIHELNAEVASIGNRAAGVPPKLVESLALARVVERKMLANEARKRDLDKSPEFLLTRERGNEALLVQSLQASIQEKVQQTTRESAQKFVSDNPQVFGDRKIFTLDQIQFLRPANIDQLPLKDAKTMGEVERVLGDANIEFRRAPQQLDTLSINPALTTEIVKIAATANGEPFIFSDQPQGAPAPVLYVNNITNTETKPFIGERAIAYAQTVLQRREIQKQLAAELKKLQDSYKPKIVYAKGYSAPDPAKFQAEAKAAAAKAAAEARPRGAPAAGSAPAGSAPAGGAPAATGPAATPVATAPAAS